MTKFGLSICCAIVLFALPLIAQDAVQKDIIKTSSGDLEITFLGHGTLMMRFAGKTIHIDPFAQVADYTALPDADLILLTHHHGDHMDLEAVEQIRRKDSRMLLTQTCAEKLTGGTVMKNGDVQTVAGVKIEAVPAYNLVHRRPDGNPFHPKGEGTGYILTFGKTRVYVGGDTENTPEMKALKDIDIAFLPMNLPYTMTPEMVADAAKAFKPKILYPYHFGETDTAKLTALMKETKDVEIRIRSMK
ncbi:MAG: MBL fold metallo-hydrolase [Bacteroidetes bacterium]|nr:MBL fold metallo-hydrolase [Bacteroidota bacterium]